MLTYVKRHMVAFVALFIAILSLGSTSAYAINSIRSSDIVDGQVKNADIGANAVGNGKIQDGSVLGADIKDDSLSGADIKDDSLSGADIKDDTLAGADIDESTLGQVPNAKTLDGVPLDGLHNHTATNFVSTSDCVVPNSWLQCAPLTVVVPAGHNYVVTVWSSVTVWEGDTRQEVLFCPAFNVPTCFNGAPEIITLAANAWTNGSTSASAHFGPGTYTFSTAAFFSSAVQATNNAHTATTVEYHDYQAEGLQP